MFYSLDLYIMNLINSIQNPFFDIIMLFFSFLGNDGFVWIIIILAMFLAADYRKYTFILILSLMTVMFLGNKVLKNFFNRPRPFHTFPNLRVLVETSGTHSFPSSHTAVAFTVFGIFLFFKLRGRLPVFILSAGIAVSRIYLNVHYFWDIIGGMVLGLGTAYLFFLIYRKINFLYIKNVIIKVGLVLKNMLFD